MFDDNEMILDFDTGAPEYAQPERDFSPIPEGIYNARIDKVELKPTKDGTGLRLVLMLKICGPSHVGRVVVEGLNVANKNPAAQAVGRRQLHQLLECVGMVGERDMSKLAGEEVSISVAIKPASGGYAESNSVKKFLPLSTPGKQSADTPTTTTEQPKKKAPAFMR